MNLTIAPGTLTLVTGLLGLLQMAAAIVVGYFGRKYPGVRWWNVGIVLQCLAWPVMSTWPAISAQADSYLAISTSLLAAGLQVASLGCAYVGATRFAGRQPNRWALAAIGAGFSLSYSSVLFAQNNYQLRTIVLCVASAAYAALAAWALVPIGGYRAAARATRMAFVVFAITALLYALRAGLTLGLGIERDVVDPSLPNTTTFLLAIVMTSLWLYALIALVQVRQQSALQSAQQFFARTFELMPDPGAVIRATDGRIIATNLEFTALTRIDATQAATLTSMETVWTNAEDRQQFLRTLTETGKCTHFETGFARPDGSTGVGHFSASTADLDGVPHVVTLMRDVTERKQLDEALRESEELFRGVYTHSPIGIEICDQAGRVLRCNPALLAIFGVEDSGALGAYRLFDDPRMTSDIQTQLLAGQPVHSEIELDFDLARRFRGVQTTRTGVAHLDVSVSPLRSGAGANRGYLVQVQDITTRKGAERALRESERRHREMVELAHEGIWALDAQDSTTFANPRLAQMLGFRAGEELLGRDLRSFLPADEVEAATAALAMCRQGAVDEFQLGLVRQDGVRISTRFRITPIRTSGGAYEGAVCLVDDITDRRRAEAERTELEQRLFQSQKLESIGKLAGGIAHNFNNLLAVILGNTSLLEFDVPPQSPLRASLKAIETACDEGAALCRQLLGFAQRGRYDTRSLDPATLITEAAQLCRSVFDRSIQIVPAIASTPWIIQGDLSQVHQVLMNLAINSRDAMPHGGTLTLAVSNVVREAGSADAPAGRYVLFEVTDTGTGIRREDLGRIFDPFFTTKPFGKSAGMGLAAVHGIVLGHGGFVEVQSEPGNGTTMRVYLPASPEAGISSPAASPAPASEASAPRAAGTVLVIDDEQPVRETTRAALAKRGYNVLVAGDGAEGLSVYARHSGTIDLVILDMGMPVMGGLETAQRLRSLDPNCRILVASGYSAEGAAEEVLAMGRATFIQKPVRARELAEAVEAALR